MKQSEWVRIVATWARIWPNRPLPAESIEPWFALLADLDGDTVRAALMRWAADPGKSWPPQSPGELRSVAEPDGEDWSAALARLADLIRRHPYYDPPRDLDDQLAEYVRSLGGWASLCRSIDLTDTTTRAQFRDYWRVTQRRQQVDRAALAAGSFLPELNSGRDSS